MSALGTKDDDTKIIEAAFYKDFKIDINTFTAVLSDIVHDVKETTEVPEMYIPPPCSRHEQSVRRRGEGATLSALDIKPNAGRL